MNKLFPLLLLLTSCATPIQIHYVGDEPGYQAAQNAAKQWHDVCNQDIVVSRTNQGIPLIQVADIHEFVPQAPKYISAITVMRDDKPRAILFENHGYSMQNSEQALALSGMIAHEFGHVLGIHYHTSNGLMQEKPDANDYNLSVSVHECQELNRAISHRQSDAFSESHVGLKQW